MSIASSLAKLSISSQKPSKGHKLGSFSLIHWLILGFIGWILFRIFAKKPSNSSKNPRSGTTNKQAIKTDAAPLQPDAIEGDFWEVEHPKPSDVLVHLIYKDANGLRTRRTVNVNGFATSTEGSFSARCMMRNAQRTFLYNRVEQAIEPGTGEIITDLPQWLLDSYNKTPQGKASQIATDNLDLLKVLLYVAKADGRMTAAEISVISSAATEITGIDIDADVAKSALNLLATPSLSGYKQAIGRLIKQNYPIAEKALHAAKGIVATQKSIHPAEQEAVDYFESKLIAV